MITKQVNLNTWSTNNVVVYANSGEVDSRYIEISFKDEEENNIDLSGRHVTIYIQKPDNTTIFNYCTVNTSNNTAVVELTSQALSVPGILECEFQIFDGENKLLKVRGLKIFVSTNKDFSEAVESISESNVLASLINDVKEIPGTTLYDNISGTTGTITLNQPYTNFVRIGVYAQGQYDNDAIYNEIYTHINYMTLGATSIADTQYNCTVWRTAFINFSGTVLSFINNCSSAYSSHQSNVDNRYAVSTGDGLKITRVVGYNY